MVIERSNFTSKGTVKSWVTNTATLEGMLIAVIKWLVEIVCEGNCPRPIPCFVYFMGFYSAITIKTGICQINKIHNNCFNPTRHVGLDLSLGDVINLGLNFDLNRNQIGF